MYARCKAMDDVGLKKYCCRRMLSSHVNVIDKLLLYSNNPGEKIPYKYTKEEEEEDEEDEEEEEEYTYIE